MAKQPKPFRFLTRQEFEKLTLDQKMDYALAAFDEIERRKATHDAAVLKAFPPKISQ